jgi:hypothetical protein
VKTICSILLALISTVLSNVVLAQPVQPALKYTADLAGPNEVSLEVDPGTVVSFEVLNMMPSKRYRTKVQTFVDAIPPLDAPVAPKAVPSPCETRLITPLRQADSEQRVATLVALRRSGDVTCTGEDAVIADTLIKRTSETVPQTRTVRRDRKVVLTVERRSEDGATVEKSWRYEFSGGPSGDWLTSYGFNFIPNGDERFQAVADPSNSGSFVIERLADREKLDFAPSLYFNWRRTPKDDASPVHSGPLFGLGFEPDEPIVFAGWGFDIGTNVTIALGGAFHKEARLAGKYDVGQSIGTQLDEGQLAEKTYDASLFVGFGFRLNKSPFSSGDKADTK